MFQDILKDIISKSDELYNKLNVLRNNFNDDLNLNLYNYKSINYTLIESTFNNYIQNIQSFIDYIESLSYADINTDCLGQLFDIICDKDLSIFKLKNIHPDNGIQELLNEKSNQMIKYTARRLLECESYNKLKFVIYESTHKNIDYIKDFIKSLESFTDDNQSTQNNDNPPNDIEDNSTDRYNIEETINNAINEFAELNVVINHNDYMGFTLWDNNMSILEIVKNCNKIGYIYLDIYNRENKKNDSNVFLLTHKFNIDLPVYCLNFYFDINKDDINNMEYEMFTKILNDTINLII
jgi:Zn-dependent oligopeptidase